MLALNGHLFTLNSLTTNNRFHILPVEGQEEVEEISLSQLTGNAGAMEEGVTTAQPSNIPIPPPENLSPGVTDEELKENSLKLIGDQCLLTAKTVIEIFQ